MKRITQTVVLMTLLAWFHGAAMAANEIRVDVYTGTFDGSNEILTENSTPSISVTRDAGALINFNGTSGLPLVTDASNITRINVYTDDPDEEDVANIGTIIVLGNGSHRVHVIVGRQDRATITEPPNVYGLDFGGLDAERPIRFQMRIAGDINGHIQCEDIRRIDVGGSHLQGTIEASLHGPRIVVIEGDMAAGGDFPPEIIAAGSAGILEVRVDGDLAGRVETETETLGSLTVGGKLTGVVDIGGDITETVEISGDIGASTANATIAAGGEIAAITAGGDVWADISVNGGEEVEPPTPTQQLPRLEVFDVGGDLHGTFHGPSIRDLDVGGDLHAELTVGLVRRGVNGNDEWRINGSFKSGARIVVLGRAQSTSTARGLRGPIVFNNGFNGGQWENSAVVEITRFDEEGVITLTGPDYTNPPHGEVHPLGVGGGGVGVASFNLQGTGCFPAAGSSTPLELPAVKLPTPPLPEPITEMEGAVYIRHYGPVTWDEEAENLPVVVERRRIGDTGSWTDITEMVFAEPAWMNLVIGLGEVSSIGCGGQNVIGFFRGFDYKITPRRTGDEAVRCLEVATEPLVNHGDEDGYIYEFTVPDPCPADLNGDGVVNSTDNTFLLGVWGPCDDPPCVCLADLNLDGMVGSSDLAILLASWGSCGESLMGGGLPPVVEHYEFESVEDYMNWLNSLSESELIDHIVEVIEWLTS